MGSKKPFWEYTLPSGVNIGRVDGVVLVRTIGPEDENFDFLATIVQIRLCRRLIFKSAQLGVIGLMTDDHLAECWLIASRQVARVEFLQTDSAKSFFAPLLGSVFKSEPTTVQSMQAARKVIQSFRAMGEHQSEKEPADDCFLLRAMKLLEAETFTADDQAWADVEFNTMPDHSAELEEWQAWLVAEAEKPLNEKTPPVSCDAHHGFENLMNDLVKLSGRKHLQATGKRATQHASRNKARDEAICAEYECLRKRMSDENARAKLASTHDLSIERIKQIVKAGLPKNL